MSVIDKAMSALEVMESLPEDRTEESPIVAKPTPMEECDEPDSRPFSELSSWERFTRIFEGEVAKMRKRL